MNRHKIKIEYFKNSGYVDDISFSISPNNIATSDEMLLENNNVYDNPFLLNLSKLDGKSIYSASNGLNYYISSQSSDDNGNIDISMTFTTVRVNALTLIFPSFCYPTNIYINNKLYYNKDSTFQLFVDNGNSSNKVTTTIRITKINLPNNPFILLSYNTGLTLEYDDKYIKSIQRGSQLSTDNVSPKYEFVSQYGSCSFVDEENIILNMKSQGNLRKPNKVEIFLNDEIIGTYKVESWNYDSINRIVNIELIDSTKNFQNITIEEKKLYNPTNVTLYDVLYNIKELINKNGEELLISEDPSLTNWLNSITLYSYRYEAMTLNNLINNFCSASQCSIYKNEKGILEVFLWR